VLKRYGEIRKIFERGVYERSIIKRRASEDKKETTE
jgi:hypothetical protein